MNSHLSLTILISEGSWQKKADKYFRTSYKNILETLIRKVELMIEM